MPDYIVTNRNNTTIWKVQPGGGVPATGHRAVLSLAQSQRVNMGQEMNIALAANQTGLHTFHLADCVALCILWRDAGHNQWQIASLTHIPGGPDPNAVDWNYMLRGMMQGGTCLAIVAYSRRTVLQPNLTRAITARGIPQANVFNYIAYTQVINFGVDWNGFVGEC